MSFTKFPVQVRQAILNRELSLRQLDVYLCLSAHCDFRTGDVYQWVSMSFVAGGSQLQQVNGFTCCQASSQAGVACQWHRLARHASRFRESAL